MRKREREREREQEREREKEKRKGDRETKGEIGNPILLNQTHLDLSECVIHDWIGY